MSLRSVWETIGPISSRSGKKMSTRSIPFSWRIEIWRAASSSFAWTSTSPVSMSTTSWAACAPSSSASSIFTASTPAFRMARIAELVIFLALWMTRSEPLISMSSPARRPTRLSLTLQ